MRVGQVGEKFKGCPGLQLSQLEGWMTTGLGRKLGAAKKPIHKHEMFISNQHKPFHCFPTKGGNQARDVKLLF